MNRQEFENIVQTYGAEAERWPEPQRADMLALLDADAQARAILGREAALDSLLSAMELPVSDALETRIRNDMLATLGRLNAPLPAVVPPSEAPPLHQAAGAFVVALAACLTLGIVTTPDILGLVFGNDEMLLALDIVGNEFLN